jgi:hypothetical protein
MDSILNRAVLVLDNVLPSRESSARAPGERCGPTR